MTAASVVSLPVPAVVGIADQKWKPLMYFEQTFHLLNALVRLYDPGTCSLGTIHGGSAAKCNDCLGSFCQITALWPPPAFQIVGLATVLS